MTLPHSKAEESWSKNWLWAVLAIGLILRILYLVQYSSLPDWHYLTVDNWYHLHWAERLAAGDWLGDTTYFRAPFYILCLGLLKLVFGASLWVPRMFGLVIGMLSIGVTYAIGRELFDRRVATVAAALHAVYPVMIYFESELLLDPLFTLLFELALLQAIRWYRAATPRNVLLLGLLIGLASITRPTGLILLPVLLSALWVLRNSLKQPWLQAGLLVAGLGMIILPVTARNIAVAGDPVLISSQGGINLYLGNHETADGLTASMPEPYGFNWQIREITYEAEKEEGRRLKAGELSSYWVGRTVDVWLDNPVRAVGLIVRKLGYNFTGREVSNNRSLPTFFHSVPLLRYNPLNFYILFFFAGIGLLAVWRSGEGRMLLIIGCLFVLATALFFFSSRFRLPVLPLYFVMAGVAPFELWRRYGSKRASLAAPIILGLVALGLTFIPLPRPTDSPQAISLNSKGLNHYHRGEYRQALEYFQAAVVVDSTLVDLNLNLGAAWLRLGAIDSAVAAFEREERIHPERPGAPANLASVALLQGEPELARRLADQALGAAPYHLMANRVRLRATFEADSADTDLLLEEVALARKRTSNDPRLLLDAGLLLSERQLYDAAEAVLLDLINDPVPPIETDDEAFAPVFAHSPEATRDRGARADYQLGFLAGMQQRYYEAIRFSERAIEADSSLAEAWVNLAGAYRSVGDVHSSDSVLTEATKRFPSHPAVQRLHQLW